MIINGEKYKTLCVFPSMMTVPDSYVSRSNKVGSGNGEAKLYISSKENMHGFYGDEGFEAKCIMLKSDLIAYMNAIKNEYSEPSQNYRDKESFPNLWNSRMEKISQLEDVIEFTIKDQNQIEGDRGYVKSNDIGYNLIREIALPMVSFICAEKIGKENAPLYYWRLFADFNAIKERKSLLLSLTYAKPKEDQKSETKKESKKAKDIRQARDGQGKYREQLLEQCRFCPITMIADERLLIASHIKPWAASNDDEKIDPFNGYILSPMIDKLFDRGFITFTENRHMILSEFISPFTWKQIGLKNNVFFSALKMDDKRIAYLNFHHQFVFKGSIEK